MTTDTTGTANGYAASVYEPRGRQSSLTLLCLVILAVAVCSNLSDLAVRGLSAPSILQWLIALLALAVWRYRDALRPSEVIFQPLTLFLLAYCFVLFLSSIGASDAAIADERLVETAKSQVIFLLAGTLAATRGAVRAGLAALTVTATALASLTIFQTITGTRYEFGGLARFKVGNVYGDVNLARASGPLDDPNFYAQLLVMMIPIAIVLALSEGRLSRRLLYIVQTLVITTGALLTYSRGAMIALAVMAVSLAMAIRVRLKYAVAAIAAMLLVAAMLPAGVKRRTLTVEELLPSSGRTQDASIEERKLFLGAAWQMFSDHPLLGVGAGNFATHFNQYALLVGSPAAQYHDRGDRAYPHMLYLQIGAETGLLGLLCFGSAIAASFISIRRTHQALLERDPTQALVATGLTIAIIGYLVTAIFLHGAYQRILWILLGFVAAVARLSSPASEVEAPEVMS